MALTDLERKHAESITEPAVVVPIPPKQVAKILVASVVRKPPVVLSAFLQTVASQQVEQSELSYFFVTDFAAADTYAPDSLKLLSEFCGAHPRSTSSLSSPL